MPPNTQSQTICAEEIPVRAEAHIERQPVAVSNDRINRAVGHANRILITVRHYDESFLPAYRLYFIRTQQVNSDLIYSEIASMCFHSEFEVGGRPAFLICALRDERKDYLVERSDILVIISKESVAPIPSTGGFTRCRFNRIFAAGANFSA